MIVYSTPQPLHGTIPEPAARASGLRVALAHDWLVGYRGGEAVLDEIAKVLTDNGFQISRLYTMFDSGVRLSEALDALPRQVSGLNRLPGSLRRWLLPLYPWAVGQLTRQLARDHDAEPIDLLISTSSAAIKGLRAPEGVPHLCYCHSPARYLWSQVAQYQSGTGGGLRGLGLRLFGPALRRWDKRTAGHVTEFVANSSHTAAEIQRCYGRSSSVIWPPVRTEYFAPPTSGGSRTDPSGWLYAGALEPYKRVDLAISAANEARRPLVVVGEGSQSEFLRRLAGPTVRFVGRVSESELRDQYRAAAVLVFPQIEDFGIVAVEAQACGTPVLAFGEGGALDSVIDGQTGAFFREVSTRALLDAAARIPPKTPTVMAACRANAERFSAGRFRAEMLRRIYQSLGTAKGVR